MNQYLISRTNEPFMVTHFLTDRTQEMLVRGSEVLGPIDNLEKNAEDYVFNLGEIDGIFVVSKRDGIVLSESELNKYGL